MSVKYVNEYLEEMCNICYKFKYGIFVEINNHQICSECCQNMSRQLEIYELERE